MSRLDSSVVGDSQVWWHLPPSAAQVAAQGERAGGRARGASGRAGGQAGVRTDEQTGVPGAPLEPRSATVS